MLLPERDERPPKAGWTTGWYLNLSCNKCNRSFIGDKRAVTCADCAYKEEERNNEKS